MEVFKAIWVIETPFVDIFKKVEITSEINNIILHQRMLPEYLNMGFPLDKFLYDYSFKLSEKDFTDASKQLIKTDGVDVNNLIRLLLRYFPSRLHPDNNIRYYHLELIESNYSTYKSLISKLNDLCNDWEAQTIESNANFFKRLIELLDSWWS